MPRRYGADGTRLWNGKTPEEFTEADAYRFMAETEAVLQRKELMDDPAQPAPASGKEEFYLSKKDDVLLTPEQIAAEERRWLFDAPIAELAEVKGVSIDEAVKMRTDAVLQEAVVPITVSVRPIEPQGKLIGFASVNFGGVVIDDFKVVDGKNGIFLGAPSKPDPASRTGYRATVRIPDRATQERINAAGVEAYHAAVEQLVARAQAVRPAPIKEQMAEAAKQAGKENAHDDPFCGADLILSCDLGAGGLSQICHGFQFPFGISGHVWGMQPVLECQGSCQGFLLSYPACCIYGSDLLFAFVCGL